MSKPTFGGELMFPNDYLAAEEFGGKDVTLTIKSIKRDALRTTSGSTEDKYVIEFEKTKKKLVLNKTNAVQIAKVHGTKAEDWIGKQITLYPTTCMAFGSETDCIRVRD